MRTVDEMVAEIIRTEGGYVDDPTDRGGATNYGVSLKWLRAKMLDLDGDGDVDADDIKLVTPAIAAQIFKEYFFYDPQIDKLPEKIQPQVFDMSVHHGQPRAIMMVQQALNDGFSYDLDEDGRMGPRTARAAKCIAAGCAGGPHALNNELVEVRLAFMRGIYRRRPSQLRYKKGWERRARGFRVG